MARVRRGFKARRRRNKVLKLAKGFSFDRRTKYKHTAETVKRALHYAYVGRRLLKRDMRKYMFEHPELYIGKTLEFKYQQLSKYGVPRHAYAVKIRED